MVLSNQLLHFHSTPTHLLPVYKSDQRSLQGRIFLAHAARVRHSFLFARPKWRVFSQLQNRKGRPPGRFNPEGIRDKKSRTPPLKSVKDGAPKHLYHCVMLTCENGMTRWCSDMGKNQRAGHPVLIHHGNLLIARVKITSYTLHCSAPFFRAFVVYICHVYSE